MAEQVIDEPKSLGTRLEELFGWAYYKRGNLGHTGVYHYLSPGTWKSVCGHWKIEIYEKPFVKFIPFVQVRPKKQCRRCIQLMGARGIDITK